MQENKQTQEIKPEENKTEVKRIRSGTITASIFAVKVNGKYGIRTKYNISIQKRYVDKDNIWKYTNTFGEDDIIRVKTVLDKATQYIYLKEDEILDEIDQQEQ